VLICVFVTSSYPKLFKKAGFIDIPSIFGQSRPLGVRDGEFENLPIPYLFDICDTFLEYPIIYFSLVIKCWRRRRVLWFRSI